MKHSIIVLVIVALFGLAWLGRQFGPMLYIGAGYLAKTLCSEYFVAGRTDPERILARIVRDTVGGEPDDMQAFTRERLLPAGWMHWSTTPAPAAPRGEYGAQFWLNAGKDGEHHAFPGLPANAFFASGFNDQIVAVFPDQEIVVVRLGFTTDESWDNTEFLGRVLAALD